MPNNRRTSVLGMLHNISPYSCWNCVRNTGNSLNYQLLTFYTSFSQFLNFNLDIWVGFNPMELCCKIFDPVWIVIFDSLRFLQSVFKELGTQTEYVWYVTSLALFKLIELVVKNYGRVCNFPPSQTTPDCRNAGFCIVTLKSSACLRMSPYFVQIIVQRG